MDALARSIRPFEVTNRTVLAIAIPMTFAYLSTPILGLVDTGVIGQLGDAALIGGIALGGILFDLVFTTFNFLRSGTTGLTAQALGAEHRLEERAVFFRAALLAIVIGVVVVLARAPLLDAGLMFMGGSAEVQAATRDYFLIRALATPFSLLNYAVLGWFVGRGRAGIGLLLQIFLNGLNIVLSILFVLHLGWGIEGVAGATVIAEFTTALVGLGLVTHAMRGAPLPSLAQIVDKAAFRRMIAINRDIMIRSFTLLFAFAFFTARSAAQGDVTLAANAILEKFFLIGGYFLDGFATAAEQLAGKAIGARYRPAFDRAVRLTLIWGFVLAGLAALVLWSAGNAIVAVMTTAEAVRAAADTYLVWAALTPLFGVLAFQMDGVFIGATWSRDMRNMMLLSLATYLAAYTVLFPQFGNHGLWMALEVFLGVRGISLGIMCRRRAARTFSTAA